MYVWIHDNTKMYDLGFTFSFKQRENICTNFQVLIFGTKNNLFSCILQRNHQLIYFLNNDTTWDQCAWPELIECGSERTLWNFIPFLISNLQQMCCERIPDYMFLSTKWVDICISQATKWCLLMTYLYCFPTTCFSSNYGMIPLLIVMFKHSKKLVNVRQRHLEWCKTFWYLL